MRCLARRAGRRGLRAAAGRPGLRHSEKGKSAPEGGGHSTAVFFRRVHLCSVTLGGLALHANKLFPGSRMSGSGPRVSLGTMRANLSIYMQSLAHRDVSRWPADAGGGWHFHCYEFASPLLSLHSVEVRCYIHVVRCLAQNTR
jgi:hypothetical protein